MKGHTTLLRMRSLETVHFEKKLQTCRPLTFFIFGRSFASGAVSSHVRSTCIIMTLMAMKCYIESLCSSGNWWNLQTERALLRGSCAQAW